LSFSEKGKIVTRVAATGGNKKKGVRPPVALEKREKKGSSSDGAGLQKRTKKRPSVFQPERGDKKARTPIHKRGKKKTNRGASCGQKGDRGEQGKQKTVKK